MNRRHSSYISCTGNEKVTSRCSFLNLNLGIFASSYSRSLYSHEKLLMKFLLPILFLISFTFNLQAQGFSVSGSVYDGVTGQALSRANVFIFKLPDSTRRGMTSDAKGGFTFQDVEKGRYVLRISFIGYETVTRNFQVLDKGVNLGRINMKEDSIAVSEVEVTARQPIAVVKDDTTEFQAGAFKTNPDASAEDLVKKVPGVTVQGGQVQAQGETVRQVLVDGKPMFGMDPTAVLKTLPAELIDRVQVFDQQTEQAQFTGVRDGNESKAINLITKNAFQNSRFGKIYGAYGSDDLYRVGGNVNWFSGKTRLSFLGMSNNINEQNFSIEDILGATGQGGGFGGMFRTVVGIFGGGRGGGATRFVGGSGGRGFGGISDFTVGQQNGIAQTHAIGLNYSDQWGQDVELSTSYFFNLNDNNASSETFRQYLADSGLVYDEKNLSDSRNINHRFNMRFDWKLDTTNSILVRPRLTLQQNESSSDLNGKTTQNILPVSGTASTTSNDYLGINFSNELLYRHRFEAKGRTFSINLSQGYNKNSGDSYLLSQNNFFGRTVIRDTLNQFSSPLTDGWSLGTEVAYTEPIIENSTLEFRYEASLKRDDSDRRTYDFNQLTSLYDLLDPTLSSTFNSDYMTHSGGARFQYDKDEFNMNIGATFQVAKLTGDNVYPFISTVDKTFQNILPSAHVRYRFTRESHLRMFYRARTNAPSITQLQDVVNNSNPLQLSIGNPDLKQAYSHNMNFMFVDADIPNAKYFFGMVGGSITDDNIGNHTIIAYSDTLADGVSLLRGTQLTKPVNLDGAYSLRSMVTYGFSWPLISSNLNLNAMANVSRSPGLINNELNYTLSPTFTLGAVVSSNISPEVDFTISSQSIYSIVDNSLRKELNTEYFMQNTSLKLNLIFLGDFVFSTDLNHQLINGLSSDYNERTMLWNMSIGRKFFDNTIDARLVVFDLLKENNNIARNVTDVYFEDVRSNVLQQYFLFQVTYNLKMFGG